jgi:hypothetical protein
MGGECWFLKRVNGFHASLKWIRVRLVGFEDPYIQLEELSPPSLMHFIRPYSQRISLSIYPPSEYVDFDDMDTRGEAQQYAHKFSGDGYSEPDVSDMSPPELID